MKFDINTVIMILLIAGAINWGLVAYNGTDLVALAGPTLEKYIKYTVGAAGAYALFQFVQYNV
jgi:uncharacterized membrane protein YuzA (DUF378 family)